MDARASDASTDAVGFRELLAKIERERGIPCSGYKDRCLMRRVSVRMRATGVHTCADYAARLDREPSEWDRLLAALTINVTRFFRDESVFDVLEQSVYPRLRDEVQGPVRAWSAGCSHGQEALSLAIGLAECVGVERTQVLATDVDVESLAAASGATFPELLMADVPPHRRERWFTGANPSVAVPSLHRCITVQRHDLLRDPVPARGFHLIACRNVIIYFGREAQAALFGRLHDALAPGGVLVLGKVETLVGEVRERFVPLDSRERVYRRIAA